jgi:sulfur carrier protein
MEIRLNGKSCLIDQVTKMTVAGLLELENVTSPEMVAVQINGEIVDRGTYHNTMVADRNEVDFLYFMAGGS